MKYNENSGKLNGKTYNEDFNQIENWKCHMFDFWLIPLDRITYGSFDTTVSW